jgi:hypothetical protein
MAKPLITENRSLMNLGQPHDKQKEVLTTKLKRIVLNWGRRSGKSFLAGMKVSIGAVVEQGNYYIIAPTGGNAKKIYWDDILKVIWKNSPLVDKQFVKSIGRKDYNEVGFNENEMSVTIDYIENAKVTMPDGRVLTINHDTARLNRITFSVLRSGELY